MQESYSCSSSPFCKSRIAPRESRSALRAQPFVAQRDLHGSASQSKRERLTFVLSCSSLGRSGAMTAFENQHRSDGVRRKKSPTSTLVAIAVIVLLGLRFANQARQQRQQVPIAPPIQAPEQAEPAGAREAVKVVRVVDGDTVLLEHGVRVRFLGVNTPEIAHDDQPEEPLGQEAKEFTRRFLKGKSITLRIRPGAGRPVRANAGIRVRKWRDAERGAD
jgi:endonuclease YncB( thermonuclease family)